MVQLTFSDSDAFQEHRLFFACSHSHSHSYSHALCDQLDRAWTSVPLNLAEGNGKYTAPDRCRYFENARGSALECAACLDVLVAKGRCTTEQIWRGKELLNETVSLVMGLVKSIAPERIREEPPAYGSSV